MSVRQQIIDAMLTALNTGRPAGVPQVKKWAGIAVEPSKLPFSSIVREKESVRPAGPTWGPLVERRCRIAIEHLVSASASPAATAEENAEALLSWDVKALAGNKYNALAIDTIETGSTWTLEQGEAPFLRVHHEFEVVFTTRANDADQRT